MTDAKAIVAIPKTIGPYRILRPLSKGGMALVYQAEMVNQLGVTRTVAVKVILPEHAASQTYRDLFIHEARVGAAMQHRNLVQILDFGAEDDQYFLVMEFVEGLTLSRVITLAARHDVRVPLSVLCELGRQACDGLHHAHEALGPDGRALKMIHRDIKPSNLILNGEGVVKILDFGVSMARLRQERRGSVRGTWGYMSPEQAEGGALTPNADVFSLGVVLYELAARRAMFHRLPQDEMKEMLKDHHAERIVATLDAPYAPLVGVLDRALKRDPHERFATANELGCQLADLLPDPHTTQSELASFYRQMTELDEAERRRRLDGASPPSPRKSSRVRPRQDVVRPSSPASGQLGAGLLGAGVVLVSALIGAVVVHQVQGWGEGDAAESGRVNAPLRGVVRRPVPVDGAGTERLPSDVFDPALEVAPPGEAEQQATLRIRLSEPATLYVNGERVPDQARGEVLVPPGTHVIHVVARDGRRITREVRVRPGEVWTRQLDLSQLRWR